MKWEDDGGDDISENSQDSSDDDDNDDETNQKHQAQSFVVCSSLASLLQDFVTGKPISSIVVGSKVYGCYRRGDSTCLLRFNLVPGTRAALHYGLHYHTMESEEVDGMLLGDILVTSYGLLLPMELDQCGRDKQFCLVTSDWRTLDSDGKLVQPYQCLVSTSNLVK